MGRVEGLTIGSKTHILHNMLPHPQTLLLHLHHVVLLVLGIIDLFQLEDGTTHRSLVVEATTRPQEMGGTALLPSYEPPW